MSIWPARKMFEEFGDVKGIYTQYVRSRGILYLEFFDIRNAIEALGRLNGAVVMQHTITIQCCTDQEMSQHQMFVYGSILSYDFQPGSGATTIMVSYYDIHCAAAAVNDICEKNQNGKAQCWAECIVQHQPRNNQESYSERSALYSTSSAAFSASPATSSTSPDFYSPRPAFNYNQSTTQSGRGIDGGVSPEPVSLSTSSNDLHSVDGIDLVATTTRLMDMKLISPTPEDSIGPRKKHGHAAVTSTAFSRATSANTLDTKGADRSAKAVSFSAKLPAPPTSATTDASSDSSTNMATSSHKVGNTRRARSFSVASVTVVSKSPRSSLSSSGSTPSTSTTSSTTTHVSAAEKSSNELSGTGSSKGILSNLIEGNGGPSDKRTTLMVRNIPNKYTQQMFLEWINQTHHGKFDFLYLRMDFKNKCNVGYAFVNFISVEAIESFAKAHVGQRWPRFNSDKICELAYAKVQGQDALVDKFRNSSVMKEDPSFRPMILYTSGPRVGEVKPFPESNVNQEHPSRPFNSVRRRHSSKV
ncbi:hypothetical protein DFQ27_003844 [Actinomortierella ambigua]|uniref:RRM domain-containing protein n=1 Tax=Actinomortierella ambigua TaxID=1343610 RepID=A0A9P6U469_9FUNG|nr:hypothetical protein DFQ27_003844 [Actinomortierella ambigua]